MMKFANVCFRRHRVSRQMFIVWTKWSLGRLRFFYPHRVLHITISTSAVLQTLKPVHFFALDWTLPCPHALFMAFPTSSITWILLLPPGQFQDPKALVCHYLSSAMNGLLSLPLDARLLKDQRPCSLSHPMFPYAPNNVAEHMNNDTLSRYEHTDLSISVNN